jgi:DNA-binding beta-propeller fold protein YncE
MATATQIHPVQLQYSHTIGRAEFSGPGFRVPVGIARGAGDRLYVLNRAYENRPDGKRVTVCTVGEEYISEFGRGVSAEQTENDAPDGRFFWPTAIALDKDGNVYISDEWYNRISIFSKDGDWVGKWGTPGSGDGELNRPSGIAFDKGDHLYVVDSLNNRVQVFDGDGNFVTKLLGEATMSKWGQEKLNASPEMLIQRQRAQGLEREKQFWGPTAIEVDDENRIFVADSVRSRIQVYRKQIPLFVGDRL